MQKVINNIKEKMIYIIKQQPEDSSYDEILQELSFLRMVNNGLNDSKKNKITDTETLKKEIKNW